MNCVVYARYSSEKQNEKSIEDQLEACEIFAKENGFTIVNQYIDRAKSGKTDQRPGFQQMIKDSKKKLFKVVLCWKFDRISRQARDYYYYEKILYDNGVNIVSINEIIEDPQAAPIVKAVNLGIAESYNVTLAINVNRGMMSNAKKCKSNGPLPFGYISDKQGNISLDENIAPFIKEAYQHFLNEEVSYTDIAQILNSHGLKNKQGKPITAKFVKRILSNKKYTGVYQFSDVVVEDGMPAIVDKETFYKVQEKMKNYKRPHNNKINQEEYLLNKKLFCYECNSPMAISCGTSKTGKLYRYYKCNCRSVRKDYIEPLVVELTKKYILTDENIEKIADYIMALQKELKENAQEKVLERELKEIQKKIDNVCNLFLDGLDSPAMREKLEQLENDKKQTEIRLQIEKSYNQDASRDSIVWYLKQFQDMDIKNEKLAKKLMDSLVMYVYLMDDKIWIQYKYAEENKNTQALSLKELECSIDFQMVDQLTIHSNISIGSNGYYILLETNLQDFFY